MSETEPFCVEKIYLLYFAQIMVSAMCLPWEIWSYPSNSKDPLQPLWQLKSDNKFKRVCVRPQTECAHDSIVNDYVLVFDTDR